MWPESQTAGTCGHVAVRTRLRRLWPRRLGISGRPTHPPIRAWSAIVPRKLFADRIYRSLILRASLCGRVEARYTASPDSHAPHQSPATS